MGRSHSKTYSAQQKISMTVAVDIAVPIGPKPTFHCSPVPQGYVVVAVDEVMKDFEELMLDHPAGEDGELTELGEAKKGAFYGQRSTSCFQIGRQGHRLPSLQRNSPIRRLTRLQRIRLHRRVSRLHPLRLRAKRGRVPLSPTARVTNHQNVKGRPSQKYLVRILRSELGTIVKRKIW